MKNKLLGIFQIIVTVFFIYYTLSKIGLNKIFEVIKTADLLFILFASIVYFLSQIISSERLWFILKENNLIISSKENIKLYMVGIFYNFFIPGGVGGDAYKGVLMNKKFQWSLKKIYKLLILDRLIGFGVILCLIIVFSGFILDLFYFTHHTNFSVWINYFDIIFSWCYRKLLYFFIHFLDFICLINFFFWWNWN